MRLPSPEPYFAQIVARLRELAAADLVGVYAGGSYALGAYEAGRSDLDVAAVVRARPPDDLKHRIVAALRHESLACPARGLEFVLYTASAVARATSDAAFELNLNTGATMPFRTDFEPAANEKHWYPIDRSILAGHGIALFGPPSQAVFAPIPRELLFPLLAESLRRQLDGGSRGDDAVLNAARTWMYIEQGVWSSKPAAGAWAARRDQIAARALAARHDTAGLGPADVRSFVEHVLALVQAATPRQT